MFSAWISWIRVFSPHEFYKKHENEIELLTKELADAKARVDVLYARWHELEEIKTGKG